jgi:type II secretory pathway predicted ATPase ExeA
LSSNGFILVNSLFYPIFADPESIKILGYPNAVANPAVLDSILTQKILSFVEPDLLTSARSMVAQFKSGRRHYLCKAFVLGNNWDGSIQEAKIALLLERGLSNPPSGGRKRQRKDGMHEDPFSFSPDPKYYCFSRAHLEVLAAIRKMIQEGQGISALIAQAGMGKTILLNYLEDTLRMESDFAHFSGSFETRAELVRAVMASLGVPGIVRDEAANLECFQQWLIAKALSGRRVVLICDNAQDMDSLTLEHLCMFSDLQMGHQKLLQIVIVGRQGLIEKLSGPRLEVIGSKINVFCRLSPIDEVEVRNYILHRLRIGGCTQQLFSTEALSLIAQYSRGIPLNINMICRHCLSMASTVNIQVIDERIVDDSAYDLVLRSQPFTPWDNPKEPYDRRSSADRHKLRLVKK